MAKLKKRKYNITKKKEIFHPEIMGYESIKIFKDEIPLGYSVGAQFLIVQQKTVGTQTVRIPVLSVFILNIEESLSEGGEAIIIKKHKILRSPIRPHPFAFEETVQHFKNQGCKILDVRHVTAVLNNLSTGNSYRRCMFLKSDKNCDTSLIISPALKRVGKFLVVHPDDISESYSIRPKRKFEKQTGLSRLKKRKLS